MSPRASSPTLRWAPPSRTRTLPLPPAPARAATPVAPVARAPRSDPDADTMLVRRRGSGRALRAIAALLAVAAVLLGFAFGRWTVRRFAAPPARSGLGEAAESEARARAVEPREPPDPAPSAPAADAIGASTAAPIAPARPRAARRPSPPPPPSAARADRDLEGDFRLME